MNYKQHILDKGMFIQDKKHIVPKFMFDSYSSLMNRPNNALIII